MEKGILVTLINDPNRIGVVKDIYQDILTVKLLGSDAEIMAHESFFKKVDR